MIGWEMVAKVVGVALLAALGVCVLGVVYLVRSKGLQRKRAARRSQAIRAYIGKNGSGKTWTAIFDLLPDIEAGRRILSTTPIYDPKDGGLYWNYVPLRSWLQFLEAQDCVIFMDEIAGVADARQWQNVPAQMGLMLQQLRKRNVILVWTGIRFALADANLRRLTWAVVECKSLLPAERRNPWASRRVIVASLFDASDFDSFDQQRLQPGQSAAAAKPNLLHRAAFWRARHAADRAYKTKDQTLALDSAESGGTCVRCHGRRTAKKCTCPDELLTVAALLAEAAEGQGSAEAERCGAAEPGEALVPVGAPQDGERPLDSEGRGLTLSGVETSHRVEPSSIEAPSEAHCQVV